MSLTVLSCHGNFLFHTFNQILHLRTVHEPQSHNSWAIFRLCSILFLFVWTPEVLTQEDLLHCERFFSPFSRALLSPKTIQLTSTGRVTAWWSWLIWLKALAWILCVGMTIRQTCGHMDMCHFCSRQSLLCSDSFWSPENPMRMTIAWGDVLGSVVSTVCVSVCYSLDMQSLGLKQWASTLSQQQSEPECTH